MDTESRQAACLEFAPTLDELAKKASAPHRVPRIFFIFGEYKFRRHGDSTLEKPTWWDRLRPRLHNRYWNWDDDKFGPGKGGHKSLAELVAQLCPRDAESQEDELKAAEYTLNQAQAIARTAYDRADLVERRATTIATSVAIATSFTLSGGAFIMDHSTIPWPMIKVFAVLLAFVTVFFVLSAWYALRALGGNQARTWNWESPWLLDKDIVRRPVVDRIIYRSADLLDDFAYNWEKADLKKRCVDNAVLCLTLALWGIGILSALVAIAILASTKAGPPPCHP